MAGGVRHGQEGSASLAAPVDENDGGPGRNVGRLAGPQMRWRTWTEGDVGRHAANDGPRPGLERPRSASYTLWEKPSQDGAVSGVTVSSRRASHEGLRSVVQSPKRPVNDKRGNIPQQNADVARKHGELSDRGTPAASQARRVHAPDEMKFRPNPLIWTLADGAEAQRPPLGS